MPTMISTSMPVTKSADISDDGTSLPSSGEENEMNYISGAKEGDEEKAAMNGDIRDGSTSTDLASDESILADSTVTSPSPFFQLRMIYSIILAGLCLFLVVI